MGLQSVYRSPHVRLGNQHKPFSLRDIFPFVLLEQGGQGRSVSGDCTAVRHCRGRGTGHAAEHAFAGAGGDNHTVRHCGPDGLFGAGFCPVLSADRPYLQEKRVLTQQKQVRYVPAFACKAISLFGKVFPLLKIGSKMYIYT